MPTGTFLATKFWRCAKAILVSLIILGVGQANAQFIPPELSKNIPSRLIFRAQGLVEALRDPTGRRAVVRGSISLDESYWREQFASTGGVAVLGPSQGQGFENFTITGESDLCRSQDCGESAVDSSQFSDNAVTPEINFNNMANAMLISEGGFLRLDNLVISDLAAVEGYQYSPQQPYRSVGLGSGTWPTLALAPDSQLVLINVTMTYRNPSPEDTCEQYNQRAIYSLQQVYGTQNITAVNKTAARFPNGVVVPVDVFNGSDNTAVGKARIYVQNATFSCLPPAVRGSSGGLSTGALAAVIAAPVAAALLLGLAGCWCYRRRRRRQQAADAAVAVKDVELGPGSAEFGSDASKGARDQTLSDDGCGKVLAANTVLGPGSGNTGSQRSSGQYHTASYTTGSYPGSSASAATSSASAAPATPAVGGATPPAPAGLPLSQNNITSSGGSDHGSAGMAVTSNTYAAAKAAAAVAAVQQPSLHPHSAARQHSNEIILTNPSAGQFSVLQQANSLEVVNSDLAGASSIATWPRSSEDPQAEPDSSGGHNTGSYQASAGAPSGGGTASGGNSGGPVSIPAAGLSNSPGTAHTSGMASGRSRTASDRANNISMLLKARSDMAVLRDLKIGPLLGRGSYGRVYKGRWKAVTVAVKIIEHHEGSMGTASSGGKRINVGRETMLATSMAHPNVVQTYHISTMTVSQRNALANSWLEEERGEGDSGSPRRRRVKAAGVGETEEYDHDSSSDDAQKDPVETWMLMEFCEKGSLERAIGRGRFIRKDNSKPEMIGIYKALLDTASGLDYLHSIGVVHGDLKTANVLLKGSTRDVRGFACKISDFGLSRVLDMDATHISTRTYGTIVYMPAELLLTGRMTQATDIYSFGLMMWELYTSTRVFEEGLSIGQIFYMIAYQNWRPPIPPGCPPGYAALMSACWHPNPDQRPTVQQLLRSLQSLYMAEKKAMAAAKEAAALAAAQRQGPAAAGASSAVVGASTRYKAASAAPMRLEGLTAAAGGAVGAAGVPWQSLPPQQQQQQMWPVSAGVSRDLPTAVLIPGEPGVTVGEAHGSGASLATVDYAYAADSGEGGKTGPGSGDTIVTLDENVYQPWAEAVTQDLQQDEEVSAGFLDCKQQPKQHHAAAGQQQQQQYPQQQDQHVPSAAVQNPYGAVDRNSQVLAAQAPHLQQQQQQPAAGRQSPKRYRQLQLRSNEIQPAVDNEPLPSESLFQPENMSSGSNVTYGDVQDLDTQLPARQQPTGAPYVAPAAHSFVEAIELVARPGVSAVDGFGGVHGSAAADMQQVGLPDSSNSSAHSNLQGMYYAQQRAAQYAGPPVMQSRLPGSVISRGGLLPGQGSFISSVSTGTLPPTLGDSNPNSFSTSAAGSFTSPGSTTAAAGSAGRWAWNSAVSSQARVTAAGSTTPSGSSRGPSASGSSPAGPAVAAVLPVRLPSQTNSQGPPLAATRVPVGDDDAVVVPLQGGSLVGTASPYDAPAAAAAGRVSAAGASAPLHSPFAQALHQTETIQTTAVGDTANLRTATALGNGTQEQPPAAQQTGDPAGAKPQAAASPFAALAYRGESLFAPL